MLLVERLREAGMTFEVHGRVVHGRRADDEAAGPRDPRIVVQPAFTGASTSSSSPLSYMSRTMSQPPTNCPFT